MCCPAVAQAVNGYALFNFCFVFCAVENLLDAARVVLRMYLPFEEVVIWCVLFVVLAKHGECFFGDWNNSVFGSFGLPDV